MKGLAELHRGCIYTLALAMQLSFTDFVEKSLWAAPPPAKAPLPTARTTAAVKQPVPATKLAIPAKPGLAKPTVAPARIAAPSAPPVMFLTAPPAQSIPAPPPTQLARPTPAQNVRGTVAPGGRFPASAPVTAAPGKPGTNPPAAAIALPPGTPLKLGQIPVAPKPGTPVNAPLGAPKDSELEDSSQFEWMDTGTRAKFDKITPNPAPELTWELGQDSAEPMIRMRIIESDKPKPSTLTTPYFIELSGKIAGKENSLLFRQKKVKVTPDGKFKILVSLESEKQELTLLLIKPSGDFKRLGGNITVSNWENFRKQNESSSKKRFIITPGVSFTLASFRQSKVNPFDQYGVTAKLSTTYILKPNYWDIGAVAYYTAVPRIFGTSTDSMRFLGFNIRGGYQLTRKFKKIRFKIMAGYYFLTSFASQETFGFRNVGGPQLFPVVEYQISPKKMLVGYLKFSPISNNFSLLALNNSEVAGGLAYAFPLAYKHKVSVGLDLSFLQLNIGTSSIYLTTYNLGMSYTF